MTQEKKELKQKNSTYNNCKICNVKYKPRLFKEKTICESCADNKYR